MGHWLNVSGNAFARPVEGFALDALVPFEILNLALVLFRSRARFEGAEIAALAGFWIHFSGIEPVFAGLQFTDHGTYLP